MYVGLVERLGGVGASDWGAITPCDVVKQDKNCLAPARNWWYSVGERRADRI